METFSVVEAHLRNGPIVVMSSCIVVRTTLKFDLYIYITLSFEWPASNMKGEGPESRGDY